MRRTILIAPLPAFGPRALETKGGYMARLRSGAQKYETIDPRSITARIYGDAAVAHSRVRMAGKSNGRAAPSPGTAAAPSHPDRKVRGPW